MGVWVLELKERSAKAASATLRAAEGLFGEGAAVECGGGAEAAPSPDAASVGLVSVRVLDCRRNDVRPADWCDDWLTLEGL